MFGQVLCSGYELTGGLYSLNSIKFALIILNWILTFSIFVPLHNAIETSDDIPSITKKLEEKNWSRTLVWTLVLITNLVHYTIPGLF